MPPLKASNSPRRGERRHGWPGGSRPRNQVLSAAQGCGGTILEKWGSARGLSSPSLVYNGLMWYVRRQPEEAGRVDVRRSSLNRIWRRSRGPGGTIPCLRRSPATRSGKRGGRSSRSGRTATRSTTRPVSGRRATCPISNPCKVGSRRPATRWTLSLGKSREDGVHAATFRISHRPGVEYERVRQIVITYDKTSGRLEAGLVVEVKLRENHGQGRVAVDLGATLLLTAIFEDSTALLPSGRLIKAVRRSWQKVRAKGKPPAREKPGMFRRYRDRPQGAPAGGADAPPRPRPFHLRVRPARGQRNRYWRSDRHPRGDRLRCPDETAAPRLAVLQEH